MNRCTTPERSPKSRQKTSKPFWSLEGLMGDQSMVTHIYPKRRDQKNSDDNDPESSPVKKWNCRDREEVDRDDPK
jgi:hypothetical protein